MWSRLAYLKSNEVIRGNVNNTFGWTGKELRTMRAMSKFSVCLQHEYCLEHIEKRLAKKEGSCALLKAY